MFTPPPPPPPKQEPIPEVREEENPPHSCSLADRSETDELASHPYVAATEGRNAIENVLEPTLAEKDKQRERKREQDAEIRGKNEAIAAGSSDPPDTSEGDTSEEVTTDNSDNTELADALADSNGVSLGNTKDNAGESPEPEGVRDSADLAPSMDNNSNLADMLADSNDISLDNEGNNESEFPEPEEISGVGNL